MSDGATETRRVLYFHGFASSPESAKIVALEPLLAPRGIELVTPDMNVPSFERLDWNAMVDLGTNEARRVSPAAIVGSSLGALVALEVVRRGARAPLVLIAPALGIGNRWMTRLADGDPVTVFNHARGENAPIHRRFFEEMNEIETDTEPPAVPVIVIMGRDDETVPFSLVEETWRKWEDAGLQPGSHMIAIDGGDHGLTAHAHLIANEIARAAG